MAGTSVAKKEAASTDLALMDFGDDIGAGFENQTSADFSIPFLGVLQAMSPQVRDPDDGGIEGARAGMILNTATEEVFGGKEGMEFVPALTEHVFVEWVPREKGGGIVARHTADSPVVAKAKAQRGSFGKLQTEQGNDLVETFYMYGVTAFDGEPKEMAVIAFTSTKIKSYRAFNNKVGAFQIKRPDGTKFKPPLFSHVVQLTTVKEKNAKGEFYNIKLSPAKGEVKSSLIGRDDPRYQAAKEFKELIESGKATAAYESQDATGGSAAEGGAGDEAPF